MRVVLEALIYASCALILPLSLLPGGLKFISSWVFLNVWIQLWPPLYGILNYITVLGAQKYARSIVEGSSNGFSIFTSAGFQDLALDISVLGGYLTLSVPIISFYLLKNLDSMVHLTGSLMTPAHSAATAAAGELSTGNYSLANASMGQISYENQTSFQQNSAPSLSTGFFTDNYGTHQIKYGRDRLTVNQDPSNLNTSISMSDAYTNSLQNAQQNAQSSLDTSQKAYSETIGAASRSSADLVQSLASSDSFSSGYSSSEIQAVQSSANWVTNAAKNWGMSEGLSERESLEYISNLSLGASFCGTGLNTGRNEHFGAVSDEGRQKAESLVNSQDFQDHYQRVQNSTHNEAFNHMSDEGKRYAENFAISSEQLKSSQEQYSHAYSDHNQISEQLSFVESQTSTVNTNLNNEFVNWLSANGSLGTLFDTKQESELNCLRDSFIEEKCQTQIGELQHYKDPQSSFGSLPKVGNEWEGQKNSMRNEASGAGLQFGEVGEKGKGVQANHSDKSEMVSQTFMSQQQELGSMSRGLKSGFHQEHSKMNQTRLNDKCKNEFSEACKGTWFDSYANPK